MVNTSLGANFTFTMPNKFIDCRFLRVHIMNIANSNDLQTKQTGLVVTDIIGAQQPDSSPLGT